MGAFLLSIAMKGLGLGRTVLKAVLDWLARRSVAELGCIALTVAFLLQGFLDHRVQAKLSGQLRTCSGSLADARSALEGTVANYRAAAAAAEAADKANNQRVAAEAKAINERNVDDYEARLADARARADRLREQLAASAHSGGGATAGVPATGADRRAAAEAAGENGFSVDDRLLATEQAIQLDQLIKTVRALQKVDPNAAPLAAK